MCSWCFHCWRLSSFIGCFQMTLACVFYFFLFLVCMDFSFAGLSMLDLGSHSVCVCNGSWEVKIVMWHVFPQSQTLVVSYEQAIVHIAWMLLCGLLLSQEGCSRRSDHRGTSGASLERCMYICGIVAMLIRSCQCLGAKAWPCKMMLHVSYCLHKCWRCRWPSPLNVGKT